MEVPLPNLQQIPRNWTNPPVFRGKPGEFTGKSAFLVWENHNVWRKVTIYNYRKITKAHRKITILLGKSQFLEESNHFFMGKLPFVQRKSMTVHRYNIIVCRTITCFHEKGKSQFLYCSYEKHHHFRRYIYTSSVNGPFSNSNLWHHQDWCVLLSNALLILEIPMIIWGWINPNYHKR